MGMHMRIIRPLGCLLTIFSLALLTLYMPGQAQQAADNTTANDIGALPVSFVLNNAIDAHEQDIRQKIFEYEFMAAENSPSVQSDLVRKRSEDLKKDTLGKKKVMSAILSRNGSISPEQLGALASEMSGNIDRLSGFTRKLEEKAAGLSLLNGHKTNTDTIAPLLNDISDGRGLAAKMIQAADDKKNGSLKNNGKNH
jgi:hypothetical protein